MPTGPDFADVQTSLVGGAGTTSGRGLAILAPHVPSGSQVSANVVKPTRIQRFAESYFGAGSDLAEGFRAAKGSGLAESLLVGVAPRSGSPFTETFGTITVITTFTLNAARLPITGIASVTVDGAAISGANILYTHLDPFTQTVAAGKILFNLATGKAKLGTGTTGASTGAIVQYASDDWDSAFEVLDLNDYEYAVPADTLFQASQWGVVQKFITHGIEENKMLAFGEPSGVAPTDIKTLVEAQATTMGALRGGDGDGRIFTLAAYYTGDLTCAIAGQLASRPQNSTRKMQPAPGGVTYTPDVSYTFEDFGADSGQGPVDGTFHEMGSNAVALNELGNLEVSDDRAVTPIDSKCRYHSTSRMVRRAETDIQKSLKALRRSSDTGIPLSDAGIQAVVSKVRAICGKLVQESFIDEFTIDAPSINDIPSADRANRLLDYFDVRVRLTGQVHFVRLSLNAEI